MGIKIGGSTTQYPPGTLAYLDTAFHGLIPCKVVAAGEGEHDVTVRLTASRGAYERGEIVRSSQRYVIPRSHVRRRRGQLRVVGGWRWSAAQPQAAVQTQPQKGGV